MTIAFPIAVGGLDAHPGNLVFRTGIYRPGFYRASDIHIGSGIVIQNSEGGRRKGLVRAFHRCAGRHLADSVRLCREIPACADLAAVTVAVFPVFDVNIRNIVTCQPGYAQINRIPLIRFLRHRCSFGGDGCLGCGVGSKGYIPVCGRQVAAYIHYRLIFQFHYAHRNHRYGGRSTFGFLADGRGTDLDVQVCIRLERHITARTDAAVIRQLYRRSIGLACPVRHHIEAQVIGQVLPDLGNIPAVPGRVVKGRHGVGGYVHLTVGHNLACHFHSSCVSTVNGFINRAARNQIIGVLAGRLGPQDDVSALRIRHRCQVGSGKRCVCQHIAVFVLRVHQAGKINIRLSLKHSPVLEHDLTGPQHDAAAGIDLSFNINCRVGASVQLQIVQLFKTAFIVPLAKITNVVHELIG